MKRILIDLTDLIPHEMGGIEQYVRDLVAGFSQYGGSDYRFTLLVQPKHRAYFGRLPQHVSYKAISGARYLKGRTRVWQVWLKLNGVTRRRFDLVHFPLQVLRFRIDGVPSIVSIMDIQHESYPDFFSEQDLAARRYIYPYSVRGSDRVIAISQFTADELHHYYDTPLDKIDVVPLAVNTTPLKRFPKRQEWLYYPAATWPHKNHKRLLQAFRRFLLSHPTYQLHLSGAKKQEYQALMNEAARNGLKGKVIHHGYVTDAQVAKLMATSRAVIFPSLFEGFGIPVVEAMMNKTPVACSNLAVLKEICNDAAVYFNPRSVRSIEKGMETVVDDSQIRSRLLRHTDMVLARYTNERLVENTLKSYDRAIGT